MQNFVKYLLLPLAILAVAALALLFVYLSDRLPPPQHLEWNEEQGYRWAELQLPDDGETGFEPMEPYRLGIDYRNHLTEDQIVDNRNLLNGSGVAVGDVTGNGFPDLYFGRLNGANKLYENQGGWQFEDITREAGVALPDQFSTGAVFADLNGNGDLDLVVSSNDAPNRIFFNDGTGGFSEQEGALDAGDIHGSTSIALADVNGNGLLDIYISNYKYRSVRDIWPYEQQFRFIVNRVDGEYEIAPKYQDHYRLDIRDDNLIWFEEGEPDLLFINRGDGNFEHMSLDSGILKDEDGEHITEPLLDWGLHAKFHDMNGNGLPDLYVANDFETPDRIWINQGDGTFQALPRLAKRKSSLSSMAVDFADIDRDGHLDYFVVEMESRSHEKRLRQMSTMAPSPQPIGAIENRPQYMGNTLFKNRGDGTYAEVAEFANVRKSDWSWSTLFLDINLNGYEDILVATGHHYDVQDYDANNYIRQSVASGQLDKAREMLQYPPLEERNAIFRNKGDFRFEDVTEKWGFTDEDVSHGMALADLNNNGSLDVVINRLGFEPGLYRNRTGAPRVAVRLEGESPNTQGTGATIRFRGGPVEQQTKEVTTGGTYLSGSEPVYSFATGDKEGPFTIEVEWRSGRKTVLDDVRKNRIYEIHEASAESEYALGEPHVEQLEGGTFFEDVSERLDHSHHENDFSDFDRQSLLPLRMSRWGPGVSWFDATGDGNEDLFIGTGENGRIAWFENRGNGIFERRADGVTNQPVARDQAGLLGWRDHEDNARLLTGAYNYETGDLDSESVREFALQQTGAESLNALQGNDAATGPLALGDYTGNGHLDLFVGKRVLADRYPEPVSSLLYRNDGEGGFVLDEAASAMLEDIGMVTGAVFSDLTGNGRPELVLSREWDALAVFEYREDSLSEITEELGLDRYRGWWNGVATGDLNENGRMDIVATNWGTNHPYASTTSREAPARIYYGDVTGNDRHEIIEAYYDPKLEAVVPRRSLSIMHQAMSFIGQHVRTFEAFARSSVAEIMGTRMERLRMHQAGTFEHMVFFNTADGFEARPLPDKAQYAPAFHVAVADLDGNGHEDLFLSQNFFAYQLEMPRSDAGRALWLKGDGTGGFEPVPGHMSGIQVYGEQRGAALADFDNDGRTDVVVTQNGAPTKLFQNRKADPGLRVRLEGSTENPGGIGARMNVIYSNGEGPVREIQAGSGYWSQNSVVQVLGLRGEPEQLRVQWPDGREIHYELPEQAGEVVAGRDGSLSVTRSF